MDVVAEWLQGTSTEGLRRIIQFFDCNALRRHYTALLADCRHELARRELALPKQQRQGVAGQAARSEAEAEGRREHVDRLQSKPPK
jgi:hypothetical protein